MAAFYKQSWFAPVASAATNFLFPSLGEAVGGGVNSLLGGALSSGTANALGSAIVGGGIGGLSSGTQGALTGALAGGATSALMGATGLNGGLSGLLGNGSFSGQAAANAANPIASGAGANQTGVAERAADAVGSASKSGGALSNILGGGISPGLIAGMALMGGLGSAMSGSNKSQSQAAPTTTTDPNMTRGLSQVAFNRNRVPYDGDPKRYGMGPQHNYFDNNAVPATAAEGGYVRRYADGGMVGPQRGMPMMAQGSPQLPPQAMMGQGPGQSPMGMPPPRPQGSPLGGMMGGIPGGGRGPMGGFRGMPQQAQGMPQRPGALMQASAPPMPGTAAFARGGAAFIDGGGSASSGRADDIPAVLSPGEYVVDAETVALLGDGSSKAGAEKLDQLREAVRRHKGGALARGRISPDAKPATSYLGAR